MTIAVFSVRAITGRKLARGFAGMEALRGLFGFGFSIASIASIAVAQAVSSLSQIHFNPVWQLAFGVVGGALGACVGAISSAGSDDRG